MLITILATILVLGVLIFVHELGHFVTAKMVDIEVPRFSIGLGPKMVGFRRGETEYVISWLPLGGYVKMAGMDEMEALEGGPAGGEKHNVPVVTTDVGLASVAEARPARGFESKSLPARTLVISAGVLMNLALAVVLFAFIAAVWGVPVVPEARIGSVTEELLVPGSEALATIPRGARVTAVGDTPVEDWRDVVQGLAAAPAGELTLRFSGLDPVAIRLPSDREERGRVISALDPEVTLAPILGEVSEGSPARRAGLRTGDRVVVAAGQPVESWQDLIATVEANPGRPVPITVQRGDRLLDVEVTPRVERLQLNGHVVEYGRIGVTSGGSAASAVPRERHNPVAAIAHGFTKTGEWIVIIVRSVAELVSGKASPRELGGPILIGQISGQAARAGIHQLLDFMALLSVNLAVLNLLPIPILDGGHLMFLGIEAVRGRALTFEQRVRLSQVGFVIVLALMAWAIANDVLRLFGI